ncbi:MAG: TetR/AcrR family transcriptional regulator [Propionivibrio sp.]
MKKKTEAKRQAIVDIAAEVFRESGFERASMSEICRRVGGSKATIYNYFPSKEVLFFEVMYQANQAQFTTVHAMLGESAADVGEALRRFGVALLTFIYSPEVMAVRRLVVTNACNGELGQTCFELGPKRSMTEISEFLRAAVEKGQLRLCDPAVATFHLRGLLESELLDALIFRVDETISPERIKASVERAIAVFMAAYGPTAALA